MTATEIHAIAQVLSRADHAYVGIRPADATPGTTAPAFLFTDLTDASFRYQLSCARLYWPACRRWALIGSDQVSAEHADTMRPTVYGFDEPAAVGPVGVPPTLRTLSSPAVLTTFTT